MPDQRSFLATVENHYDGMAFKPFVLSLIVRAAPLGLFGALLELFQSRGLLDEVVSINGDVHHSSKTPIAFLPIVGARVGRG